MKHKHADLIIAWANGAEIQVWEKHSGQWIDWRKPTWNEGYEYRIKPEEKKPVVRWLWANKYGAMSANLYTEDEIKDFIFTLEYTIKLEWSRTEFPV